MNASKNTIRRAVICAVGSGGDVLPFVRIAHALARRGIQATILAPERYRSYAHAGGAQYRSIGADDVFDRVFDGPDIWHPTRGLAASWTYYGAAMRTGLSQIRQDWQPHDTVLVSSSFAMAARIAEEADGFRNLTVHLSPSLFWSAASPPTWTTGSVPPAWP